MSTAVRRSKIVVFMMTPLNERQASGVDVSSDKRSSEGGDCHAVILRSVCASVNRARLLLGANVLVSLDGVWHGVLLLLMCLM
jgi:hypothetical protein